MSDKLFGFSVSLPLILTFLPACLALISAVTIAKRLAFGLLVISLIMASYFGYIQLSGLLTCIGLIGIASVFNHAQRHDIRLVSAGLIFIIAVLMLLHLAPGFNNVKVIDAVQISAGAVSFTKYLNLDKIILAIILLLFVLPAVQRISLSQLKDTLIAFMLISALAFSVGWYFDLVSIDAKMPASSGLWLFTNLFFTCFAEEAFFRGFIQQQLQKLSQHNYWPVCVVLLSGCLFGLAHFPAGFIYATIATLMGCLYAYSYWRTNNILVPITLHFLFNCMHFFLFTYPYFATAR